MTITAIRRRVAQTLLAASVLIPTGAWAADLSENLIANPSFEQTIPSITGPFGSIGVTDWESPNVITTNNLSYDYALNYTSVAPPDAGDRYFWGRGAVKQLIDLSAAAEQITRSDYDLSAYFSSFGNDEDYSTVTARFLGDGGTVLEANQIGGRDFVKFNQIDEDGLVAWDEDRIGGTIPAGTQAVEIEIFPEVGIERFFRDRGADGYVDLLSFSIAGFQDGDNLVKNPSFEETIPDLIGPYPHESIGVTNWVSDPPEIEVQKNLSYGYFEQRYAGAPVAGAGARHFWGDGLIRQELNVADGDTGAAIATGTAEYNLSAFFSGFQQGGDHSTLTARFLDSDEGVLDEVELGGFDFVEAIPLQEDGLKMWEQDSASGRVPVGTSTVEVAIFGHFVGGTTADGYVDLVEFVISPGEGLQGDCSGDGIVSAGDLSCVTTIPDRDAVLAALNSRPGDLDGNGAVDFADFLVLSARFGREDGSYADGNIDLANGVEFADFLILSESFGETGAVAATLVPEPGLGTLLLSALLGATAFRLRERA